MDVYTDSPTPKNRHSPLGMNLDAIYYVKVSNLLDFKYILLE